PPEVVAPQERALAGDPVEVAAILDTWSVEAVIEDALAVVEVAIEFIEPRDPLDLAAGDVRDEYAARIQAQARDAVEGIFLRGLGVDPEGKFLARRRPGRGVSVHGRRNRQIALQRIRECANQRAIRREDLDVLDVVPQVLVVIALGKQ